MCLLCCSFYSIERCTQGAAYVLSTLRCAGQKLKQQPRLQEPLATLVVNKLRGNLKVVAIKAPGFGERKTSYLEDIAIMTGATLVKDELGVTLETATEEVRRRGYSCLSKHYRRRHTHRNVCCSAFDAITRSMLLRCAAACARTPAASLVSALPSAALRPNCEPLLPRRSLALRTRSPSARTRARLSRGPATRTTSRRASRRSRTCSARQSRTTRRRSSTSASRASRAALRSSRCACSGRLSCFAWCVALGERHAHLSGGAAVKQASAACSGRRTMRSSYAASSRRRATARM
jgi:hypothetical protein